MKKIALATLLATLALIFAASLPVAQAQPAFTGAPRAANTWLTSDPRGFDQLRYLARHSSVLDALDAAITNVMWTLYIAETNRAQVAEGVLADAIIAEPSTNLATAAAITNTIVVVPTTAVYNLTATNLTTVIALDTSALSFAGQEALWRLALTVAQTNVSVSLPPTNAVYYWPSGALPSTSTTESNAVFNFVFRRYINGVATNTECSMWGSR